MVVLVILVAIIHEPWRKESID